MARIRTIKPEFWVSEKIVDCSPTARLLFIGMWNFCDDQGVHPASTRMLKMEVFPGDDFTGDDIAKLVSELIDARLLREYEGADGKRYWVVTGWHHQKIEKPNKKYPEPPTDRGPVDDRADETEEHSATSRRPIDDRSPEEGRGRERKGKERRGREGKGVDDQSSKPPTGDYAFSGRVIRLSQADFDRWKQGYRHIDLHGELTGLDDWLATRAPPEKRKNWFMVVSGALRKKNEENRPPKEEELSPLARGIIH